MYTKNTEYKNLFQEERVTGVTMCVLVQAVSKSVWRIPSLCLQWKTPDDGQRKCPKHVEFYSKNKLEKLVHLVGFIIRIYHDARSPERQKLDNIMYETTANCKKACG